VPTKVLCVNQRYQVVTREFTLICGVYDEEGWLLRANT
jgi:hypothetical protein